METAEMVTKEPQTREWNYKTKMKFVVEIDTLRR